MIVCMKQTFDTEERIVLKDGAISDSGVKWIMNPYDEYAVEEAIRIKEKAGGTVTVITVGPPSSDQMLRTALAMGADQAVRVDIQGLKEQPDEAVLSEILAKTIQGREFDLIFTGYMAVDSGAGQGGPRLAELLGIAHVATVLRLELDGRRAYLDRDAEGDTEKVTATLPLLITAQQGLNEPRYPSLPGIMKAKKKPLEVISLNELGISEAALAPTTSNAQTRLPPQKAQGRMLSGDIKQQVQELAKLLIQEAKVI
jgi:electron transfer flavoprotein beta subunit